MGVHDISVYKDVKLLLDIPEDEPIFILRAQDKAALDAIKEYSFLAEQRGASVAFIGGVHQAHDSFVKWQEKHPEKVKIPD